jgi:2-octaprenylphenol hydroxylase
MQPVEYEIIIVGSGPVGATLACSLLQRGMKIALIEAKPPTTASPLAEANPTTLVESTDLRTFAITRASERIFLNLAIWNKIQRISPFREMHVWDNFGEIHFDSAILREPVLGHIVEHSMLQNALTARLKQFDTLTQYRPAKVTHFTLQQNMMHVQLDNGQRLTTRLLISAEGAQSSLRTLAGIQYKLLDHGQQAIVATVQTEHPHQQTAWQRFLPTGPLAFLPLTDAHTCSIVWSIDTPLAQRLLRLERYEFHQELTKALASKLGTIMASSARANFPLQSRHALQYVKPRLALVGDAAHTILPLAGQGLNLGLLDVAALSEVILTNYERNRDFGNYQELRRYERWRQSDNLIMLKTMDSFKYLFGTSSNILIWARNLGLNLTNTINPLKQYLMQQAMGLTGNLPPLAKINN